MMTSFYEKFDGTAIDMNRWELANWSNGAETFGCTWTPNNASITYDRLRLTLNKEESTGRYLSAECRTKDVCGYGTYEVFMKPVKNIGVNSSFFTYTGPSDNNPHDEIDIEFLGKDTTKVQFNYYVNGVGGHEHIHDLGFDASLDYHTYKFHWTSDHISWYVDGIKVYTVYGAMPVTPGKVMMNLWNAGTSSGVQKWLGTYDGKTPLTASYDRVFFTAD